GFCPVRESAPSPGKTAAKLFRSYRQCKLWARGLLRVRQLPCASGIEGRFILRYSVLRLMPSWAATRVMFPWHSAMTRTSAARSAAFKGFTGDGDSLEPASGPCINAGIEPAPLLESA